MHGPLRIAIPIHSLEPGGVERVALGLAARWRNASHEVTIVLGRSGGSNLCSAPALDYWSIPSRLSTKGWRTPWMIHSLYSYLVERRPDVVFFPGNTYAIVAAAMKALLGQHAPPMVLKVSNALHRPDMGQPMRTGYGAWLRVQGRLFDSIVALSEPMRREVRERMRAEPRQVSVIANPILTRQRLIQLGRIERRPPSAWGMRYLAAGRLVPQKNFPMLLKAFAGSARGEDRLTIAGEGPDRARLEALGQGLGIAGQVRFAGHVASIDTLLAHSDALVLSSDYEGLPGVVVEALAAGLPILATDCCVSMAGLIDQGRTGIVVPPGCTDSFAKGLADLRQMRGDPARARAVAAIYEVESAADRYIDLMRDLTRRRDSNRRAGLALSTFGPSGSLRRFQ
ncbi:glycosyltransferase [Novosphingobium sp. AP12]|uniref:glycosyltransferase n=1 Tax=Novosphingobium sp. AP12 TaxID=1144305 RepID=UPI000272145B|nr:glycosyltransferase [Novosphingobium sp. AP12]EJL35014.1 glycosyltransferase [Novosphingobium sp. AP12]